LAASADGRADRIGAVTTPTYRTLLDYCQEGDHGACPHYYAGGVRLGRKPVSLVHLCPCECHRNCPLWPAKEAQDDDWLGRCACPGAKGFKEIRLKSKEATASRAAAKKQALDEVIESQRRGRDQTIDSLKEAFQRHGIELSNIEQETLPDVVQSRLSPRPAKDIYAAKALGRLGLSVIREIRTMLSDGKGPTQS